MLAEGQQTAVRTARVQGVTNPSTTIALTGYVNIMKVEGNARAPMSVQENAYPIAVMTGDGEGGGYKAKYRRP